MAVGLTATALVTLAELGALSIRASLLAGTTTYTATLAAQKLEELGTCVATLSPPGTLAANRPGYVDHLDGNGQVVGGAMRPPGAARYTRRWSVERWQGGSGNGVVLRVVALPTAGAAGEGAAAAPGAALMTALRPAGCP